MAFQNCHFAEFKNGPTTEAQNDHPSDVLSKKKEPSLKPSVVQMTAYSGEISDWQVFKIHNPTHTALVLDSLSKQLDASSVGLESIDFEDDFSQSDCTKGGSIEISAGSSCLFKIRFKPQQHGEGQFKVNLKDSISNFGLEAKVIATSMPRPTTKLDGVCGAVVNKNRITSAPTPIDGCLSGLMKNLSNDDSQYYWQCTGINGGVKADCKASYIPTSRCIYRPGYTSAHFVRNFIQHDLSGNEIGAPIECYDTTIDYPINGGVNCSDNLEKNPGCCRPGFVAIESEGCIAKSQIGDECIIDEMCVEAGKCIRGRCQTSEENGPCKADIQCQSGLKCLQNVCQKT